MPTTTSAAKKSCSASPHKLSDNDVIAILRHAGLKSLTPRLNSLSGQLAALRQPKGGCRDCVVQHRRALDAICRGARQAVIAADCGSRERIRKVLGLKQPLHIEFQTAGRSDGRRYSAIL